MESEHFILRRQHPHLEIKPVKRYYILHKVFNKKDSGKQHQKKLNMKWSGFYIQADLRVSQEKLPTAQRHWAMEPNPGGISTHTYTDKHIQPSPALPLFYNTANPHQHLVLS